MKANKVDHICVAVCNLAAAIPVWNLLLGKEGPDEEYEDEPEQIRVARYYIGEVGFEVMESTTPDGPVAKHIEARGEGIMLVSMNVDSTRAVIDELGGQGVRFIGGARPFRKGEFAFVHPKSATGVLLEYIND